MVRPTFVILLSLCLGACAPKHNDYSRFEQIPEKGWLYGRTMKFTPDSAQALGTRHLSVALRHNNEYPFRNLVLEVSYSDSPDHTVTDTVSLTAADEYGRWLGKGFGASYQFEIPVTDTFRYMPGTPINIRHIMRVDTLRGIEQVGVLISDRAK